jgi:hypothetical protein
MRRLSLASCVAVVAIATNASPAAAAVTIGETFTPTLDFGGSGVFIQSSSPGNSYTVPSDGVITSWSFEAAAESTPPLKLKVVRHAGGNDFTTIGDSQLETPTPATLNTWTTRIAVRAGDLLAHFYSDTTFGYRNAPGYGTNEISGSPGDPSLDPPPGTTITYEPPSPSSHQIDVSAVVEPDADRDGFGDESQDKCVGTPGTANGCPSIVTINKLKQKGDTKVKVTATVPGAGTLRVGSASDKPLAGKAAKSLKAVTSTLTATTKQQVGLTLKLTKSAIRKLDNAGKLKLKVKAVYTPVGGPSGSQTKKKKLRS